MEGWVKIHRKLLEWEWYKDNNVKIVFLHLLLVANHTEQKWKGKTILRGQKVTSVEHLAEETNLTVMQVRTALKKLKATNEITIKTTNKHTLVTIEKYNNYQITSNENNNQDNEQSNNEITNKQQTNNKQITTNKNDKNIKNDKNGITTIISDGRVDGFKKTDDSCINGLQEVIDFYNNNIGAITPFGLETLEDYTKEMGKELVIYAMQISVEANVRTIQYIKAILNNWQKARIKTLIEAKQENTKKKSKEEFDIDKWVPRSEV